MPSARFYVDTSAFVKLLLPEPESTALEAALSEQVAFVSSDLLKIEVARLLSRAGRSPTRSPGEWLERVVLMRVSIEIRDRAAVIEPGRMRTLDAIHLATMEQLRREIDGVLTYDHRLMEGAQALGIRVLSPR